jgi:hypothetical protein
VQRLSGDTLCIFNNNKLLLWEKVEKRLKDFESPGVYIDKGTKTIKKK